MKRYIFFVLVVFGNVVVVNGQTFIPDYYADFFVNGDANKISNRCFQITPDNGNRKGFVWWRDKLYVRQNFQLDFQLLFGTKDGEGADGFAFVLQNSSNGQNTTGSIGGGLGFQGINKSIGVEFDTWNNGYELSDPNYDHTTIVYNGDLANPKISTLYLVNNQSNVENGTCYNISIRWTYTSTTSQTIRLFVNGDQRFVHTDDMLSVFGADSVFYGFTGSTGGYSNEQTVCVGTSGVVSLQTMMDTDTITGKISSATTNYPANVMNVIQNDMLLNPVLDTLYIHSLVTNPIYGRASINATTNKIEYTPNVNFIGKDSFQYQIRDTKTVGCYTLYKNEWAVITVQCPTYQVRADRIKNNELCNQNRSPNGQATAYISETVPRGNSIELYSENFENRTLNTSQGSLPNTWATSTIASSGTISTNVTSTAPNNKALKINLSNNVPYGASYTFTTGRMDVKNMQRVTFWFNINVINTATNKYKYKKNESGPWIDIANINVQGSNNGSVLINSTDSIISFEIEGIFNAQPTRSVTIDDIKVTGTSSIDIEAKIINNYTFKWYLNGSTSNLYGQGTNINLGTPNGVSQVYGVQASDVAGCVSNVYSITMFNTMPTVSSALKQTALITNCQTPNGIAIAKIIKNGDTVQIVRDTEYRLTWLDRNNITVALGTQATGLSANAYTLIVRDSISGCNISNVNITLQADPSINNTSLSAFVTNNVTRCMNPNGSVSASSPIPNTTYIWYAGKINPINSSISVATTSTVTNVSAGYYTVKATSPAGCKSDTVSVYVQDITSKPIVYNTVVANTFCGNASDGSGSITTRVSTPNPVTYQYDILKNDNVTLVRIPAYKRDTTNGKVIRLLGSNMAAVNGMYRVRVTDIINGCQTQQLILLRDSILPILLDRRNIRYISNTFCSGAGDGGIYLQNAINTNDVLPYNLGIFRGTPQTISLAKLDLYTNNNATNNSALVTTKTDTVRSINTLLGGNYSLRYKNNRNCDTILYNITVPNQLDSPKFSNVMITANTHCIATSHNGKISLSAGSRITNSIPPSGYRFELYKNNIKIKTRTSLVDNILLVAPVIFDSLSPGLYTARVINTQKMCSRDTFLTVIDRPDTFSISNRSIVRANTGCVPSKHTGSISALVNNGITPTTDGFTFQWYNGQVVTASSAIAGITGSSISQRGAGFYTLVATKTINQCKSQARIFEIRDSVNFPLLYIKKTPDVSCNTSGTGKLSASIIQNNTYTRTGYTFRWFTGSDTTMLLTSDSIITDKTYGAYTIKATQTSTGCIQTNTNTIDQSPQNPSIIIRKTKKNTGCVINTYDGYISIFVQDSTSFISKNTSPYLYEWYESFVSPATTISRYSKTSRIDTLKRKKGQSYIVNVTNALGCTSGNISINIADSLIEPSFSPVTSGISSRKNTVCDTSVNITHKFNGRAAARFNALYSGDNINNYSFQWTTAGNNVLTAFSNRSKPDTFKTNTHALLDKVPANTYILTIIRKSSLCQKSTSLTVLNDLTKLPTLSSQSITRVTACPGSRIYPNGKIAVTGSVSLSFSTGTDNSRIKYQWFYGTSILDNTKIINNNDDITVRKGSTQGRAKVSISPDSIRNLDAGDYSLKLIYDSTGCASNAYSFNIRNNYYVTPLSVTVSRDNFACNLSKPIGEIQATSTSTFSRGVTFKWYQGNSAIGKAMNNDSARVLFGTTKQDTAYKLLHGWYTTQVTDTLTNCTRNINRYVREMQIGITLSTSQNTQTNCQPNGAAHVTNTAFNFTQPGTPSPNPPTPIGFDTAIAYTWFKKTPNATGTVIDSIFNYSTVYQGKTINKANYKGPHLTGIIAGNYSVESYDSISQCRTNTYYPIVVNDGVNNLRPRIDTSTSASRTFGGRSGLTPADCNTLGSIAIQINSPATAHTFQWYQGSADYENTPNIQDILLSGTSTILPAGTGTINVTPTITSTNTISDIDSLTSGAYSVVMTNTANQCRYQQSINLPYTDQRNAHIQFTRHLDKCSPIGEMSVKIHNPTGNTDRSYNLINYNYYLVARGIPSTLFRRIETPSLTNDSLSFTDNNGITFRRIDPDTAHRKNQIFFGNDTAINGEVVFRKLPAGIYTLIARQKTKLNDNQCWTGFHTDTLKSHAFQPIVQSYSVKNNTTCDTNIFKNGAITVIPKKDTLDTHQSGSFSFQWNKANTPLNRMGYDSVKRDSLFKRPPQTYTTTIQRSMPTYNIKINTNGTVMIRNNQILRPGEIFVVRRSGITTTDSLKLISVDTNLSWFGSPTASQKVLNFYFFKGAPTSPLGTNDTIISTSYNVSYPITQPLSSTYRTGAPSTLFFNECFVSRSYTIQHNPDQVEIKKLTLSPQKNCIPNYGSIIKIDSISKNGIDTTTSNFVFNWKRTLPSTLSFAGRITDTLQNLIAGTYQVAGTNTTTACKTHSYETILADSTHNPVIQFNGTSRDSYCSQPAFIGNGTIKYAINNALSKGFIKWFTGYDTTNALINPIPARPTSFMVSSSARRDSLNTLKTGVYTLKAKYTDTVNNGCLTTTSIEVPTSTERINVDTFSTRNNFNCFPKDGNITLLKIMRTAGNDSLYNDSLTNLKKYRYIWYRQNIPFINHTHGKYVTTNPTSDTTTIDSLSENTYKVRIRHKTSLCYSDTLNIQIQDKQTDPILDVVNITPSSYCDSISNQGDGKIILTLRHPGDSTINQTKYLSKYYVSWFKAQDTVTINTRLFATPSPSYQGNAIKRGDTLSLDSLSSYTNPYYTIRIQKKPGTTGQGQGCQTTATYQIQKNLTIPSFFLTSNDISPNLSCDTSKTEIAGKIQVSSNNVTPKGIDNYSWKFYEDNITRSLNPIRTRTATDTTYSISNRDSSTYYIRAITTKGKNKYCKSSFYKLYLPNQTINPNIVPSITQKDQGCINTLQNGIIHTLIIPQDADRNKSFDTLYRTIFFRGSSTLPITTNRDSMLFRTNGKLNGNFSYTYNKLQYGDYRMRTMSILTNCFVEYPITIEVDTPRLLITRPMIVPQTKCQALANGSIEIKELFFNQQYLADQNSLTKKFTYTWKNPAGTALIPPQLDTPSRQILQRQVAGTFLLAIQHNATQCFLKPDQSFTIPQNIEPTKILITPINPDRSCSPTFGTGELQLSLNNALSQDPNNPQYSFRWYLTQNANNTIYKNTLNNTFRPTNLLYGNYQIIVRDTTKRCSSDTANFVVEKQPIIIQMNPTNISVKEATSCNNPDGKITILSMPFGEPSDYTYTLYTTPPYIKKENPIVFESPVLYGLKKGAYYLTATHRELECTTQDSFALPLFIPDSTPPITIELTKRDLITTCKAPISNGKLTVTANKTTDPNKYTFTWYKGTETTGSPVSVDPEAIRLNIGKYTVLVEDNLTGCTQTATYQMYSIALQTIKIQHVAKINEKCKAPFDGQIIANIIELPSERKQSEFRFRISTDSLQSPYYKNSRDSSHIFSALPEGTYVLKVFDTVDTTCVSDPIKIKVKGNYNYPQVNLQVINPVTNCNEIIANGSIKINFQNFKQSLESSQKWFTGQDTTPRNRLLYESNIILNNRVHGYYTALVTNNTNLCPTIKSIQIPFQPNIPPTPSVFVLSHHTRCDSANGSAITQVETNYTQYEYFWFSPEDTTEALYIGYNPKKLKAGNYIITAKDNFTGCFSPFRAVTIDNAHTFTKKSPPFHIIVETTKSKCTESSGYASATTLERIGINGIVWKRLSDNVSINTPVLTESPGGEYEVTLTDQSYCSFTEKFTIPSEVLVYNGLSPNLDRQNDTFIIDCIELYPQNEVSIFNHQGILLYRTNGYNNKSNVFEGTTNISTGIINTKIPEGTYFYVIDLKDGTKPISGHLELVR